MGFLRTRIMGGGIGRRGFPATDVPSTEADALIRLYNATNGDSWDDNTNWLTDTTVGNWYGVTVSGGHVSEIELHINNLDGDVSAFDPTDFPGLTILYLHANSLTGDLAGWSFPSLEELRLYANSSLSGDLSSWSLPSSLTHLYLNICSFSDAPLPLPNGIETYRIPDNNLSQAVIDSILNGIWSKRDDFTYATPDLRIHGTNDAPTGTVQNTCPPTDPAEKLYNLAHAQCAGDTFNTWSILYTGGSEP